MHPCWPLSLTQGVPPFEDQLARLTFDRGSWNAFTISHQRAPRADPGARVHLLVPTRPGLSQGWLLLEACQDADPGHG
jgi:hypothetical protein